MEERQKGLHKYGSDLLVKLREYIDSIEELEYTNEQWFLDLLDEFNKESVRH